MQRNFGFFWVFKNLRGPIKYFARIP